MTEAKVNKDSIGTTRRELDWSKRPDRLGQYMEKHVADFLFGEFSGEFIRDNGLPVVLENVPVPLKGEDLVKFSGGHGLSPDIIADNMVRILGVNPHFKYADEYRAYILTMFDITLAKRLVDMSKNFADEGNLDEAFIYARAALVLSSRDRDAMYNYTLVTRMMYLDSEDMEYVGRCKADCIEYLEVLTEEYPEFAPAHYFLGYAYLNLGMYIKAQLTWKTFLQYATSDEEREEISKRLLEIREPAKIEIGTNEVMAGRFEKGIEILEPYVGSQFEEWWPLHFFLGVSYLSQEQEEKAEECFKKVIRLNPSHIESYEALMKIYEDKGDWEKVEKYQKKLALLMQNEG